MHAGDFAHNGEPLTNIITLFPQYPLNYRHGTRQKCVRTPQSRIIRDVGAPDRGEVATNGDRDGA
jgi:hypothetical protein